MYCIYGDQNMCDWRKSSTDMDHIMWFLGVQNNAKVRAARLLSFRKDLKRVQFDEYEKVSKKLRVYKMDVANGMSKKFTFNSESRFV